MSYSNRIRILPAACCLLFAAACSEEDLPLGPEDCAAFTSVLTIRDRMGQPVDEFVQNEPITFEMQVTNTRDAKRTLVSPDGCPQVAFRVDDAAGETVWSSLDGVACTLALVPVEYGPGGTLTYSVVWHQQSTRGGGQVPVGDYVVHGIDRSSCGVSLSRKDGLRIR